MNYNVQTLSDEQLLKSLVKESKEGSFKTLLNEHALVDIVYDLSPHEISEIVGIGRKTTERLIVLQELVSQLNHQRLRRDGVSIKSPNDVYQLMYPVIGHLKVEEFHMLALSTKNIVIDQMIISRGSLNASIVHPREVFRRAIKLSSASIVPCSQSSVDESAAVKRGQRDNGALD